MEMREISILIYKVPSKIIFMYHTDLGILTKLLTVISHFTLYVTIDSICSAAYLTFVACYGPTYFYLAPSTCLKVVHEELR